MRITLLIDADIIAYKCALLNESVYDANRKAGNIINRYIDILNADEALICLSDKNNWRKHLLPSYKHNRKDIERPVHLDAVKLHLTQNYTSIIYENLEADDVMGILSTHPTKIQGKKIIVSEDKDMRTIPGWLYNPNKDIQPQYISELEADRFHLYQTLTGDSTDGYKGCPNIGPVKATKILDTYHQSNWWNAIVDTYKCQGLSEGNALTQARIARICRATDYDFTSNNVLLWHPSKIAVNNGIDDAVEERLNELDYEFITNDTFLKAKTLHTHRKYIQAIQLFSQLADLGHTESQYQLGLMHFNAEGADEDHDEAVYWFHEAAQQNFAPAEYKLGEMYLHGTGIEQNNDEAFYWFNKAAEQNNQDAQKILKKLFLNGKRVDKKDILPAIKSVNVRPIRNHVDSSIAIKNDSSQQDTNDYKIGDTLPDDSIIFYIDNSQKHGLAVQKKDIPNKVTWNQANQVANEYGLEWHLPTMNEMTLLFEQRSIIGDFSPNFYWSSLESSIKGAWLYSFDDGNQISSFKSYANRARAVRSFLFDQILETKVSQTQLIIYKLGDILSDGSIVFYLDSSGQHGISVKKNDTTLVTWAELNNLIKTYDKEWRLPTKGELEILYKQKTVSALLGSNFWISTEYNISWVWAWNIETRSNQYNHDKGATAVFCAVRDF